MEIKPLRLKAIKSTRNNTISDPQAQLEQKRLQTNLHRHTWMSMCKEHFLDEDFILSGCCKDCLGYCTKRFPEQGVSAFDHAVAGEEPFTCLIHLMSLFDAMDICDHFIPKTPLHGKVLLTRAMIKNKELQKTKK